MQQFIDIHTDGGARGNPGPAAIGYVIRYPTRKQDGSTATEVFKTGKYIGYATNNQAEYEAVTEALRKFQEIQKNLGDRGVPIMFSLDSLLVVNQLNGLFKIKVPDLRTRLLRIRELEGVIGGEIRYRYVPREQNFEADALVNQALNSRI